VFLVSEGLSACWWGFR